MPDVLYHYTSLAGLDGIASSQSVWASAAQYMNDSKEYTLAVDIARRQVARLAHSEKDKNRAELIRYLHDQLERVENLEVCIFSLSSEGDLLSQWRAYCPPNGGYSVGFSGPLLRQVTAPQGGILAKCEYNGQAQEQLVADALTPVFEELPTLVPKHEESIRKIGEEHIGLLFSQLIFVAPLIKDASFQEEMEWRLIWIPGRANSPPEALKFRPGPGVYIPYVPFSLVHGHVSVPIEELIIGPMPHQESAVRGISGALRERGIRWHSVRLSQVPFRTW